MISRHFRRNNQRLASLWWQAADHSTHADSQNCTNSIRWRPAGDRDGHRILDISPRWLDDYRHRGSLHQDTGDTPAMNCSTGTFGIVRLGRYDVGRTRAVEGGSEKPARLARHAIAVSNSTMEPSLDTRWARAGRLLINGTCAFVTFRRCLCRTSWRWRMATPTRYIATTYEALEVVRRRRASAPR